MVVSLEHAIAAPLCTRQLADMGARVIKLERPSHGDFARHYDERVGGLSSHFVWVNRGKESLAMNLKSPEAAVVLPKLLAKADVLVQNLVPGAAQRLGLGFADLHPHYPQLIVCDISGYGQGGPYQDKKAYDLLIQSESGMLSITGGPHPNELAKSGNSIADISAGMYAYSSILNALLLRQKTGLGTHIDVSMLESLVEWLGYPLYYAYEGASPPARTGAAHATIFPYGPFHTQDGTVMLGLQNEREWQAFCTTVLQQPELARDVRYDQNSKRSALRAELTQRIEDVLQALPTAEVQQRLDQAHIASGRVNTMNQVWLHPQLRARQRWRTIDSPIGPLPALLPPGQNSGFEAIMGAIPALGQHNQAILTELGLTPHYLGPPP
ncbi:MAG: CoA transferase [Neisseriaceae bacterium]|nr:CoA transferase [Neisseriaceae bacterium]